MPTSVIVLGIKLSDGPCVGADSPITQRGDYNGNLTEAGKKSLHRASA